MADTASPDVGYVHSIVYPLLQEPQDLKIERSTDDKGVLLTISVSKPDMGRLIGKQGANIKAIRTVVQAFGAKQKEHVSIKVVEPGYGTETDNAR